MDAPSKLARTLEGMPRPRWGYAVYRCAYGNDAQWTQFLANLNDAMREGLEPYGREELLDSLDWHIVEDRALDGATKAAVRQRFDEWVRAGADQPPGEHHFTLTPTARLPRYRYCLHVDQEVIDAVVAKKYEQPAQDAFQAGFVNLIRRNWQDDPEVQRSRPPRTVYPGDEDEDEDEQFPEIEGSTEYDVGWMRVFVHSIAPYLYTALAATSDWDAFYARPPAFPNL